jgi:L-asparaginase/N4-(beta-N-acetylglucosaminyl)-L-asparaginase
MSLDRRQFTGLAAAATMVVPQTGVAAEQRAHPGPLFIATWPFGLAACKQSLATLQNGEGMLDAVERGIRVTEADPTVDSVGVGGAPNSAGVVQLDACIMDGQSRRAGSVAGLEGYPHPISVARRVMERTKHVMLVGAGAAQFAAEQGFATQQLLTDAQRQRWLEWKAKQPLPKPAANPNHDTIALLGADAEGRMAGGCSTSGLAYKLPGRVGDSPLIGGGLYVDGDVGAAGATGIGENILRYCGSFLIVEFMRSGLDPTAACRKAVERIIHGERRRAAELSVNFVALDRQGRYGAAGTDQGFRYAVVTKDRAEIVQPVLVES